MPISNVITFGENTRTMTYEEGLVFIARTRRQLDRFSTAPLDSGERAMTPEAAKGIRRKLDDLEVDLRSDLGI